MAGLRVTVSADKNTGLHKKGRCAEVGPHTFVGYGCMEKIGIDYSSYFLTMTVALWPPNPNELERAARTGRFSALLKVKLRV